jgi:hypothetical protein
MKIKPFLRNHKLLLVIKVIVVFVLLKCFLSRFFQSEKQTISYPFATSYERKDWHDWKFIEYEKTRTGPGEQGKSFELTDPDEIELNRKLSEIEGCYVIVSDKISVNRSVPDTRMPM